MLVRMGLVLGAIIALLASDPNSAAAQDSQETKSGPATVAVFSLRGELTEKPMDTDFPFAMSSSIESLKDLTARLRQAGTDDSVKAILLLNGSMSMGLAQAQELRSVLDEIREQGKPVLAHADTLTTRQYALLSGATRLSMVPTGYMFITGLYGENVFLRGLLDKMGVTPDFFTCGEYKSAAEMFMRREPSPEAAEMDEWLFDSIFQTLVEQIAAGRGASAKAVRGWIDRGVYTAERAKDAGIIDAVEHRQDLEVHLRERFGSDLKLDFSYGKKKQQSLDFSTPMGVLQFYAQLLQPPRKTKSDKDAVAIVYLEGPIMPGSSQGGLFDVGGAYSTPIRRNLDKVAEDDTIKAVVFRVNSPGGSAVASEIILDATRRVAQKKPLIISMGNVAASGGYYVACGAETIFADRSTITGSIGVVTGKLATTEAWRKIGINWTPVKRGKNAGLLSSGSTFSDSERAVMQAYMDDVYEVFKGHVTRSRGDRLTKQIDEIAGGRVYTGEQAAELGLVDEIGSLQDAIAFAARKAQLEDYEIRVVPRPKNFIEMLLSDLGGEEDDQQSLHLQTGSGSGLLDAAIPLLRGLQPDRFRAAYQALQQLSILEHERVMLTAPLWSIAP